MTKTTGDYHALSSQVCGSPGQKLIICAVLTSRFAAAKKKRHGGNKAIHLDDDGVNSSGGQGGRLSTLVGEFDHRNQSDLSPQQLAAAGLGDFVNRGSIGPRGSVGSVGGRTMHRRSLSDGVGRGSTAGGYYEEGNAATTSVPAGKRKAYWGGFFKSKSKSKGKDPAVRTQENGV